jgi:hypothetical protein
VDVLVELVDIKDDQHIHRGNYRVFDIVHHVGYEHLDDLNDVYIDIMLNDTKLMQ